jgi:hypothetical protein
VFYIPSWWRWNQPDHEKILRGNLKDLSELPPCGLVETFARNLTYLKPELHESFIEALRIRMPQAPRSQYEQVQEQDQEQVQGFARSRNASATIRKIAEVPKLLALAETTCRLNSRSAALDTLVDAFLSIARTEGVHDVSRSDATHALNEVRQRYVS